MSRRDVAIGVAVASSASTSFDQDKPATGQNSKGYLSPLSSSKARSAPYVGAAQLDALRELLSEPDWAVTRDVARLRLVTGAQRERLHFMGLAERSRPVARRRVLGRLVRRQVLATLERAVETDEHLRSVLTNEINRACGGPVANAYLVTGPWSLGETLDCWRGSVVPQRRGLPSRYIVAVLSESAVVLPSDCVWA